MVTSTSTTTEALPVVATTRPGSGSSFSHISQCRSNRAGSTGGGNKRKEDIELRPLPSTPRSGRSTTTSTESTPPDNIQPVVSRHSSVATAEPKNALQRFWGDHVRLSVEHKACRDHLALERTYLGYFRTSVLLATTGVFIAQLYVIQLPGDASAEIEQYRIGKPLATTCFAMALWIIIWGTCRYWRIQRALVQGKALSGGFELSLVLLFSFAIIVTLLVVVIVND